MKKIKEWLKNVKKRYGWASIVIPIFLLVAGGALTIWGLYMSGFNVLEWLVSPQAVAIYVALFAIVSVVVTMWGLS